MAAQPDSTSQAESTEDCQDKPANDDPGLVAKIIKQVEFYFGDKNLPRDKFLLRILHEEGNEIGWVKLENLLDFNRLKKLSTDIPFIASALKQSTSGLLEVSEDNTKIRRITPIPEVGEYDYFDLDKAIYAKGFPTDASMDDLEAFFEGFGKIALIRIRKFPNKSFKGSVFVEFSEASTANEFIKDDTIRFKDTELVRLMKKEYMEKKAVEKQDFKKNIQLEKAQTLREKVKDDVPFLTGALLKLTDIPNTTRREQIKEIFGLPKIKFVEMNIGDTQCTLMFKSENGAVDALKEIATEDNTLKFEDSVINYKLIEGDEAESEWVRLCQLITSMSKRNKPDKFRGAPKRGGRGRGRFDRSKRGAWKRHQRNDDGDKVVLGKRERNEEEEPKSKHIRMAQPDED